MANVKITELTAATALAGTDVLPIVDVGADATKKVSVSDLLRNLPDGTASAPALAFADDQNTGVLSPGDNSLAFATSGTQRLVIDSSGNVGIGTSSPSALLHVSSSGDTIARVTSADGNGAFLDLGDASDPDGGRIVYDSGSNLTFSTASTERLRIDSSGDVLIGTTSGNAERLRVQDNATTGTSCQLSIISGNAERGILNFGDAEDHNIGRISYHHSDNALFFHTNNTERLRIDSSGNVGIGTTSPAGTFDVSGNARIGAGSGGNFENAGTRLLVANTGGDAYIQIQAADSTGTSGIKFGRNSVANRAGVDWSASTDALQFRTGGTSERMRIDSSGVLTVGSGANTATQRAAFLGGYTAFENSAGTGNPSITFNNDTDTGFLNPAGNTLAFNTGGTERMRLTGDANPALHLGKTSFNVNEVGVSIGVAGSVEGLVEITRSNAGCLKIGRNTSDGEIVQIRQGSTAEGSISVSGTTVSFNGGHLSRWSQLASGAARTEILRGSVLSNLDEMCEWGEEDNEQLNRMKVSDAEGDVNVSGVFQAWDDDDDTYTNDFYCAMTGDFVIRIAQGTTVARGDLLMSAGDGTAKPQDDDIVRSKTIAKVTSTTVSTTYADGSYCVPCVLMAC